jgi:cytochrome c5
MKLHSHKWILGITMLIIVGLVAACGGTETSQPTAPPKEEEVTEIPDVVEPTSPPSSIDGEALLQQRCTTCHNLNRVTNKSWSLEQWERNVTDMINKGARLNAEEKDALVKYLAENYGP